MLVFVSKLHTHNKIQFIILYITRQKLHFESVHSDNMTKIFSFINKRTDIQKKII